MGQFAHFDLIVLFFVLGAFASWIKSDLAVPDSISKFLSILLLLSLGLKGGHEVKIAENLLGFFPALAIGLGSCLILPVILFFLFRSRLGVPNTAALAAAYGSVSAVTFITAQSLLENSGVVFSGYMVAIMALMEIPAILVGVYLYQQFSDNNIRGLAVFKSIFAAKSVVLLLGGFLIGFAMNEKSWISITPVVQDCFKGFLAFFLLDLGVVAQKQFREAWRFRGPALLIGLLFPLFAGTLGVLCAHFLGLQVGDQVLLGVLVGSASYIAAPATARASIHGSNPGLYLALPLALTFPMNVILGIPFYIYLAQVFFR